MVVSFLGASASCAPAAKVPAATAAPFHEALPLLVEAVRRYDADDLAGASALYARALPMGVHSRELAYEAACIDARLGATDLAFSHLSFMARIGIQSTGLLEASDDLSSVRSDARWGPFLAQARESASTWNDPRRAPIVVDDIERFWFTFDRSKVTPDVVDVFDREYVDAASPGLQAYLPIRTGGTKAFVGRIARLTRYYESVRSTTLRVAEAEPKLRALYLRLQELIPNAKFPTVTFIVGALAAAGVPTADGLVIGAEHFSEEREPPTEGMDPRTQELIAPFGDLPRVVIHELVHFQQRPHSSRTLLEKLLVEGGADFIAELVTGAPPSDVATRFGDAHEADLWREIQPALPSADGKVIGRWVASDESTKERPGDLGYYLGYKITKSFYDHAADKRRAIRDLHEISDAAAILHASAYAPR